MFGGSKKVLNLSCFVAHTFILLLQLLTSKSVITLGISSMQDEEPRLFFHSLCRPKSLLEIGGQRGKHNQIIFIGSF